MASLVEIFAVCCLSFVFLLLWLLPQVVCCEFPPFVAYDFTWPGAVLGPAGRRCHYERHKRLTDCVQKYYITKSQMTVNGLSVIIFEVVVGCIVEGIH